MIGRGIHEPADSLPLEEAASDALLKDPLTADKYTESNAERRVSGALAEPHGTKTVLSPNAEVSAKLETIYAECRVREIRLAQLAASRRATTKRSGVTHD